MKTFDQRNHDFCKALTDMQFTYVDAEAENANLLERMELLTTSLRNDYGIDASWDGLRRLWTIELTEDGCLMRDRACKAEAENAKLRELVRDIWGSGHLDKSCGDCEIRGECHTEIEEAYKKGSGRWNIGCLFERRIEDRMRDLGFEV